MCQAANITSYFSAGIYLAPYLTHVRWYIFPMKLENVTVGCHTFGGVQGEFTVIICANLFVQLCVCTKKDRFRNRLIDWWRYYHFGCWATLYKQGFCEWWTVNSYARPCNATCFPHPMSRYCVLYIKRLRVPMYEGDDIFQDKNHIWAHHTIRSLLFFYSAILVDQNFLPEDLQQGLSTWMSPLINSPHLQIGWYSHVSHMTRTGIPQFSSPQVVKSPLALHHEWYSLGLAHQRWTGMRCSSCRSTLWWRLDEWQAALYLLTWAPLRVDQGPWVYCRRSRIWGESVQQICSKVFSSLPNRRTCLVWCCQGGSKNLMEHPGSNFLSR